MIRLFLEDPSEELLRYALQYAWTSACFYPALSLIYYYRNALQGLNQNLVPTLSAVLEVANGTMLWETKCKKL